MLCFAYISNKICMGIVTNGMNGDNNSFATTLHYATLLYATQDKSMKCSHLLNKFLSASSAQPTFAITIQYRNEQNSAAKSSYRSWYPILWVFEFLVKILFAYFFFFPASFPIAISFFNNSLAAWRSHYIFVHNIFRCALLFVPSARHDECIRHGTVKYSNKNMKGAIITPRWRAA